VDAAAPITAGLVALLACAAGPLWTAGRIARAAFRDRDVGGAEHLAAVGAIAFALLALVVRVAGLAGVFVPWVVAAGCAATGLAGLAIRLPDGRSPGAADRLREFGAWLAERPVRALVAAPIAVVFVLEVSRALLMPPLAYDSLTYHMAFVARWVQDGAIRPLGSPFGGAEPGAWPAAIGNYARFPVLGQVLPAAIVLPFGTDLLANLSGFPWLGLVAVACHGIARRLGASRPFALLAAAFVAACPAALAYATTQYVDLQVTALVLIATLFVLRWQDRERTADVIVAYLAMGLALGTKLTAAAPIAILGGAHLAVAAARARRDRNVRRVALVGLGAAVVLAAGGEQYARNLADTGNPIHPYPLAIAGVELAPRSAYLERVYSEARTGSDMMDAIALRTTFAYAPEGRPTSAGPKFPLIVAIALAPAVAMRLRRFPNGYGLVLLLGAVPGLAFFLDGSADAAIVRRLWPEHSSRFLLPSLALASAAAAAVAERLRGRWRHLAIGAAPVAIGGDLIHANLVFLSPAAGLATAAGVAAAMALGVLLFRLRARIGRRARVAAVTVGFAACVAGLVAIGGYRDRTRWEHYERHVDLHAIPRTLVDGWRRLDRPGAPATIAIANGWTWPGHDWFFYPLAGARMQNRVVHVDPSGGDADAWIAGLERERVEVVFAQRPFPPEVGWMEARPERFRESERSAHWAIFAVEGNR